MSDPPVWEAPEMLEPLFFSVGVVNGVALTVIFVLRERRLDLVRQFGYLYLLLAIPAAYGIVLVLQEEKPAQYAIFLSIFLAFLAIEALYDCVLKIPFREHMDWRMLVPYVALYVSSSYGFVVMVWKESVQGGLLMLVLTVVQIIANALTHPRG
ncbi:MAG TPA: hypothetical protein VFJ22_15025 [Dermatophilaceae bacterium]|nr:hypothetical protein [Dermatophilaceae bacterium]